MFCIDIESNNPAYNLALEEVLLRKSDKEFFLVYINSPSVIVGKNQVANKEADSRFIALNNISLYRRLTGGGTVYHDHGNINFSFIYNNPSDRWESFAKHSELIIDFIDTLDVKASLKGKNDIRVNKRKISGNAEYVYRNRVIRHGTLLFDSDLELLKGSIRSDQSDYITRSVHSNPAEVINLKELVNQPIDTITFKNKLIDFIAAREGNNFMAINPEYMKEAEFLDLSKYGTWEWNYGASPQYEIRKNFFFNGGKIDARIVVKHGIIQECFLNGIEEAEKVAGYLVGLRHYYPQISRLFANDKKYNGLADFLF
jgi:lipoate-protein ligase A